MTDLHAAVLVPTDPRPVARDSEGTAMLIHEALARSRQQDAEEAARRHRLARSISAGRRWARLADYAARRARRSAERARASAV